MVDRHAALLHDLFQVPVAQRVSHVPANADQDHIDRETHPFEIEHVGSSSVRASQFTRSSCCLLTRHNQAATVEQLVFQRVVGQVVELLQHQYLDHQHRWIWRTAALGPRWSWCCLVNAGGQCLEVHVFGQADQRIADLCTPIFTFMLGKQADPGLHHRRYSLVVADVGILPSQADCRQVFRGRLKVTIGPPYRNCPKIDIFVLGERFSDALLSQLRGSKLVMRQRAKLIKVVRFHPLPPVVHFSGCVALLIRRRNFPGKEQGCLKLDGLVLPAHKIGRRTTSHRRDRFVNWPLRIMCMSSTPASTQPAPRNDLRLSIGLVTRLMARWSCSTMLLRCLTWRTTIGTSRPALTASMAALLAPLLSMATLSGTPFSRMALSKKRFAAAMSRLAVRRKSMVFPCLSTAR